ncbi:MAG: L-threonylcarbamoyladenylate synthase [Metamycoplasmataceae bacterium]
MKNNLFITTTDTIIGIATPLNEIYLKELYEIKKRPLDKKIVIALADIDQLKKMENLNEKHFEYINKYWPGPTTLIINGTAYRIPDNNQLRDLIRKIGPIYLTSANLSGMDFCKTIDEAKRIFPSIKKVYNFGIGSNKPSNIINTETGEKIR